jgi:HEAT repeat protein
MKSWRIPLALLTAAALALPAPAGILFGKKTKTNPAERVPELIVIVKTDKDESKRAAAAEELRQYDPAANPDIVPVLIDVLMNDAKPAVRAEAAESLGKIRPVSQEAGWALEQAQEKDSSWRVRTKARYVLMTYHWAGYHSDPKLKDGPAVPNPKDPPAEKGKVILSPVPMTPKSPAPPPVRPVPGETQPPPLADPGVKPSPVPMALPPGPAQPPAPGKASPLPPTPGVPPPAPAKTEPSPLPIIPLPPAGSGPSLNEPGE